METTRSLMLVNFQTCFKAALKRVKASRIRRAVVVPWAVGAIPQMTWLVVSPIVGMMIQSDELIFFRGVGLKPPIRWLTKSHCNSLQFGSAAETHGISDFLSQRRPELLTSLGKQKVFFFQAPALNSCHRGHHLSGGASCQLAIAQWPTAELSVGGRKKCCKKGRSSCKFVSKTYRTSDNLIYPLEIQS